MRISRTGLILCLGLVASVALAQAPKASLAQDKMPDRVSAEAWQIVVLINQDRTAQGLAPLKWDPALAVAARKHCLRMALEGTVSHRFQGEPDAEERAGVAGAHFSLIIENLGMDTVVDGIHQQWADSRDNRANMLNPEVDRVGVGVVSSNGMLYAVADFARFVQVLTQAQVEAAIAGLLRAQGLNISHDPRDARGLCNGRSMVSLEPSFVMIWETADLTQLPADLVKVLPQAHFRKASVGNCPVLDTNGDFNSYRVAALFYSVGVGVY
jgi:uncharacterized protein YkwD